MIDLSILLAVLPNTNTGVDIKFTIIEFVQKADLNKVITTGSLVHFVTMCQTTHDHKIGWL